MLIKLSNNIYINPDKITLITPRGIYDDSRVDWVIAFDAENRLTLSQAHFDELMACLPQSPVELKSIGIKWEADETGTVREYKLTDGEWIINDLKENYDEEVEQDVGHGTYIVEIGGSHG